MAGVAKNSIFNFILFNLNLSSPTWQSGSVLGRAAIRKIEREVKADVLGLGSTVNLLRLWRPTSPLQACSQTLVAG